MLNRKFVRTDDAMKDSEETATAFNVSQTSHNSRKKLQFANPRIKIQENVHDQKPIETVSFRRIATVEQLQLEQTHTHSQLYRIPRVATPRGIISDCFIV